MNFDASVRSLSFQADAARDSAKLLVGRSADKRVLMQRATQLETRAAIIGAIALRKQTR